MREVSRRWTWLVAGALFVGLAAPATADAQYFGRNKVRYASFDFQVLETEHFDIYFYPAEREAAEYTARMAERWYARLSELLRHDLSGRQPLILYASHPHFQQTTALPGEIGEGTGGATEAFKRRIVLPLAGGLKETDHVLGHEIVHAFQFDVSQRGGVFGGGLPSALALPLWFGEGMAEYLSLGPNDPHTAMWMRDAVARDRVPAVRDLYHPRFFPYRYGHALWAFVAGTWGDERVGEVLKEATQLGNPELAFNRVLGVRADSLSRMWRAALAERFGDSTQQRAGPEAFGRALFERGQRGPSLHLAPSLSPDGERLVFFSERDRYAVEMFLADVESGEVLRKVVRRALDPHFQSLQFIHSAGAWHPQGKLFAFAAVSAGEAILTITDVESGRTVREFRIREADEVFNPTWAPDGRRLAFTGQAGGLLDLFVIDSETGEVRRLTDDPYADLHPAWSPDGRRIAFVTDRFTSDLTTLRFGAYRLALIDPEGGSIEALPAFEGAKHINPQWSGDGQSLFYVTDVNGVSNVHRLGMATGESRPVTNLKTGVSGITPLSPAISVSGTRLAFSAYTEGRYELFVTDAAAGTGVVAAEESAPDAGRLPPLERKNDRVEALLANDTLGLPPADVAFDTRPYRPGLSLDYVAPISVGVGSSRSGAFVGGGTGLLWSDMLGRHQVQAVLQVAGTLQDITGLVGYQHLGGRWNKGVLAGQTTLLSLGFRRTVNSAGTAATDSLFLFRQIDRQVTGVLAYPFSRVSRAELIGGYRMSSFDREVQVREITTQPPLVSISNPIDLPAPERVHLGESSVALVHDNALFGPTAPILGRRMRLEAGGTVGGLRYASVLGDVRQYVMPVRPYTLAARVVHFGRYGRDADDERLFPLFIGYHSLVRGYGARTFDLRSCPAIIQTADDCPVPVFERLLGSKILVGNVELRFPLTEGLGLGRQPAFLPPLDGVLFFDAGVAWDDSATPSLFGGTRDFVTSYGASIRMNLFGVAILELGAVRPNDRPDRGWHFLFGIAPGF